MPYKSREDQRAATKRWRDKSPEHRLLVSAKSRARTSNIDFMLLPRNIKIPDCCPILKIPLYFSEVGKGPNTPSIDRIDNSIGYEPGNVRVISLKANKMKGDMSIPDVEHLLAYMKKEL